MTECEQNSAKHSYACNVCNEKQSSLNELYRHAATHDIKLYVQFVSENEDGDKDKKTKKYPSCSICGRSFQYPSYVKRHIRKVHTKDFVQKSREHVEGPPFVCKLCQKQFDRLSSLRNHERVHSRPDFVLPDEKSPDRSSRTSDLIEVEKEAQLQCSICERMFRSQGYLDRHEKLHKWHNSTSHAERERLLANRFECESCGKRFRFYSVMKIHQNVHTHLKVYRCDICRETFTHSSSLKYHYYIHLGEKPFECDTCGKCFRKNSHLTLHKYLHSGNLRFKCEYCKKRFNTRTQLRIHSVQHTLLYPFRCDICNKGLSTKRLYFAHMDSHDGTRSERRYGSYPCEYCDRVFKLRGTWLKHQSKHTGNFEFKCNICQRGFLRNNLLLEHYKKHSESVEKTGSSEIENVCDICGNRYTKPFYLKQHYRRHTGALPYLCSHCGKRFNTKVNMTNHIAAIHTREYPFTCSVCTKGYCRKDKLAKHIGKFHPELEEHTEICPIMSSPEEQCDLKLDIKIENL